MTADLLKKEQEQKETISSAKNAIRHILGMNDIMLNHKKRLLSEMIWKITQADGLTAEKRTNFAKRITYISESVKDRREAGNDSIKDFIHEHVYMREGLIKKLLDNPKDTEKILENAIGCIVTKEEHSDLPHRIEEYDGWERYKKAHIRVWSIKTQSWVIDRKDFIGANS